MTLSLDTAYRSFGGEVEASSTPTICRLPDSRRHQLSAIAHLWRQRILLGAHVSTIRLGKRRVIPAVGLCMKVSAGQSKGASRIVGHEYSSRVVGHDCSSIIVGHEYSSRIAGHEYSSRIAGHEYSSRIAGHEYSW